MLKHRVQHPCRPSPLAPSRPTLDEPAWPVTLTSGSSLISISAIDNGDFIVQAIVSTVERLKAHSTVKVNPRPRDPSNLDQTLGARHGSWANSTPSLLGTDLTHRLSVAYKPECQCERGARGPGSTWSTPEHVPSASQTMLVLVRRHFHEGVG